MSYEGLKLFRIWLKRPENLWEIITVGHLWPRASRQQSHPWMLRGWWDGIYVNYHLFAPKGSRGRAVYSGRFIQLGHKRVPFPPSILYTAYIFPWLNFFSYQLYNPLRLHFPFETRRWSDLQESCCQSTPLWLWKSHDHQAQWELGPWFIRWCIKLLLPIW
jgi:hypothetical protein